jgi:hypothetical protein
MRSRIFIDTRQPALGLLLIRLSGRRRPGHKKQEKRNRMKTMVVTGA